MEIQSLFIKKFKSLDEVALYSPNPFSCFVGANASGKSNIFEFLEFVSICNKTDIDEALRLFGDVSEFIPLSNKDDELDIEFKLNAGEAIPWIQLKFVKQRENNSYQTGNLMSSNFGNFWHKYIYTDNNHTAAEKNIDNADYKHFFNFSRIFVGNTKLVKQNFQDDSKLNLVGSNLEKLLKRLLRDENKKNEMIEWLQLLIPGFEKIEIESSGSSDNLWIYEKGTNKPFQKNLISDGTFNLLCILAAVFQSEEPQFLCIEEPENGLNPKVIKELVNLFRQKCNEGHYIWLNTHSQSLVSELTTDEIILVDKVDGKTQVKQIKGMDLQGLKMDEALLTNSLGGGIPW